MLRGRHPSSLLSLLHSRQLTFPSTLSSFRSRRTYVYASAAISAAYKSGSSHLPLMRQGLSRTIAPSPAAQHQQRYVSTSSQAPPAMGLPKFPTYGLLPKKVTQSASFIERNPTFDGRGIRVGILDTGVDPAARGLDGKGKVVDVIDCTGTGDVPLVPVEAKASSQITDSLEIVSPFTGRTLLLPGTIKQPEGTRLLAGFKRAYELWPKDLVQRRKEQRAKNFQVESSKLVDSVSRQLADLEASKDTDAGKSNGNGNGNGGKAAVEDGPSRAQQKDELKARLAVLADLASSYEDIGPLLDVVTFFDGTVWRTVVGGAEGDIREPTVGLPEDALAKLKGQTLDLRDAVALADFHLEQKHDVFGPADLLTYSVNHIFEHAGGDHPSAVSLVTLSGSHGTHVAGIVGAHLPDSPDENGVAPGVEIVSLKIGDTRVKGMETSFALLRAAQAAIATRCDILNMSFGEDGAFGTEGKGAFAEALRDIVIRQKDILFVSSAGNSAPALTTLGQPAGTTDGVFTIGAYVTAGAMQNAEYALIERDVKDGPTTWSSRGPAADGARGVTAWAPGAAITSIPKYCLSATQLMNGTSMASPNACGCIALLLSAMKQEGIPITSARVHKAVLATTRDAHDELGVGFLQVEDAWRYIVENKDRPDADFEFQVKVTPAGKPPGGNSDKRGVYLRERAETHRLNQFTVTAKPTVKGTEPEKAYELQLKAVLTSSAPWIVAPEFLHLGGNGRSFEIRVDPTKLTTGLHSGSVKAYDSDSPGHLLFEVPVVVTKPEVSSTPTVRYSVRLERGAIERNFLHIPQGATWAEARFRSSRHATSGAAAKFWAHLVAVEPQRRLSAVEHAFVLSLNEGEPVVKRFPVKGGQTLEVCLAEMWNQSAGFDLDCEIELHGLTVGQALSGRDELTLIGGEGLAKLEVTSHIRIESFKPTISFAKRRTFIRPESSTVRPLLSDRNAHPSGRQLHELVNSYRLSVEEAGSVKYSLPTSSPLSNLYDSAVPMLSAIYEANTKRLVAFGDVYPKEQDLKKGEYEVKVQWISERPQPLNALKTAAMKVDHKLSKGKDVTLSLYDDHIDAFGSSKPVSYKGNLKLWPGERKVLTLDLNLHGDALPKEAQPGDVLVGEFSFAPEGKYELRYIVPPAPKKEEETSKNVKDDEPELPRLLAPIAKQLKGEQKKNFLDSLVKDHPESLPVLLAKLESLNPTNPAETDGVLAAAERIIELVDETAVLLWLAEKRAPVAEQSDEQKRQNKKMEESKKVLVAALIAKARALHASQGVAAAEPSGTDKASTTTATAGPASDAFVETFERIRKFLGEPASASTAETAAWANLRIGYYSSSSTRDGRATRPGKALQLARKLLKDLGAGDGSNKAELAKAREEQRRLLGELGWKIWEAHADRLRIIDEEAKDFAPF
ncbi:unnamed protein product [Parajaminaea phylloscopi]